MGEVKAILFDMDGVLIDAKEWHYEAFNKALDLFGIAISRFDHLSTFDGLPTRKKLEILSLDFDLPVELHAFINEMKQVYTLELVHTKCKPYFAHEFALSSLKSQGYKIAVCSNSIRNTVEVMMEKSGLAKYIDYIVSNEDVVKSKPDPEMYLKAMSFFKLKPKQCLVIEDNDHGIMAAKAAGAHLLFVQDISQTNYTNIHNKLKEIDDLIGSGI